MECVPAIDRAIAILDLLAGARRGLTLSEISRSLSYPKSSAHRILNSLEGSACVQKNGKVSRYYLGTKFMGFNRAVVEGLELREKALPMLSSLMRKTGFTVHLSVLERDQAVVIAKLEPPSQPPIGTWVGRAMDVNSTAAGKALVAFLPPEETLRRLGARVFVRHNSRTIVSMRRLEVELARVRELGYAVDMEEDEVGTCCVGAPVMGASSRPTAAVSIVAPKQHLSEAQVPYLGAVVKQTAAAIALRLAN